MIEGPKKKVNEQIEAKLLSIVRDMLISLDRKRAAESLSLDSRITQDLGIDSLGRVELFHQVEDQFGIYLPETLLGEAETIHDIAKTLETADYSRELITHFEPQDFTKISVDPTKCQSLVEVLVKRGQQESSRVHIYYQDEQGKEHPITYGMLLENASKVAASFHQLGLKPGETVAIMLPTSPDFFYTFMGALLAGLIAVPIYPPLRPDKIEEYALREAIILKNAQVRLMVTFHRAEKLSGILKVFIPTLKTVVTSDTLLNETTKVPSVHIKSSTHAFIQYTSGSTSDPKGVLLNHANLLANIRAISQVIEIKPGDVGVSWLPLYHDMGLIGTWLTSFYNAMPVTIMSPLAFLSRPERWLWSIHYHQATLSAAPNFAYELCVKKIKEEAIQGLDLSTWRLSFNGAEAINTGTLERFYKKFAPFGLSKTMMYPAYGLAESSVALILPEPGKEVIIDKIDKESFETEQVAKAVDDKHENFLQFVCEGKPLPGHEVKIVDDEGNEVEDRIIGRLIFKGPSMMQGYYRNPEATQAAMVGDYIDSGDYAYKADGQYYVTGRKKDIIIKAGRNYYPEEVEGIVSGVENIRKGCIIAFGVVDEKWSTEKLIIVAETKLTNKEEHPEQIKEINEQVSNVLGIPPDEVILIPPGSIPKTSSGKLQRSKCKQMYVNKEIKAKRAPMWQQVAKLGIIAGFYKLGRAFKYVGRLFYSIYVYLMVGLLIPLMWFASLVLPKKVGRPFVKRWARLSMALVGMPVKINNKEAWPEEGSFVFVANHASYIDAVVLFGTVPSNALLVGKKEVFKYPFIGPIATTLGAISVDRYDFNKNIEDTKKIIEEVEKGNSIAIFPEGTFTDKAGLREFKLGAFRIAADTKAPIVPIAIQGTRHIFRGTNPLLAPGVVRMQIGPQIKAQGDDWDEVTRLHKEAKAFIAEHCGEQEVEF